ncbi:MAG TPA: DUF3164 family protein [Desulfobacterales bacterium]|nr:DUF3164 family protein [Desulfobacterales bacterium]
MTKKDKSGSWIAADGSRVPAKYVPRHEKDRERVVNKLFKAAELEHQRLVKLKELIGREIMAYVERRITEYNIQPNKEGNYSLPNFAGDRRVELKIGKFIEFDDRLQYAKAKIDNCLERWSEGADSRLRVVVFDAFKVDKKGRVDVKRILGLRKLEIKDKVWTEAMELISKAVTVVATKQYFSFRFRETAAADWQTLKLDLSAI